MAAVQICSIVETASEADENGDVIKAKRLCLNKDALDELLKDHAHKKLIVVSCLGAMRGGKSTFLSWLCRMAMERASETGDVAFDRDLFKAAWGRTPCTSGIWGKVVERDAASCWLFLDTQGLFDMQIDVSTTTHLFGLTSIISSLLLYNVSKMVSEDIVSHAANFASVAQSARPVANGVHHGLEFLVRDWEHLDLPDDVPSKELCDRWKQASIEYLNDLMSKKNIADIDENRNALQSCFTTVTPNLLPHPGLRVARPDFHEWEEEKMAANFNILLKNYCRSIIDRGEEIIGSQPLFGREIFLILMEGCKAFENQDLILEPLFVSTGRANNEFALELARSRFNDRFNLDILRFNYSSKIALDVFDRQARFGPVELRAEYRQRLLDEMEEIYSRMSLAERHAKQRRRRIKQTIMVVSTGLVFAPFWVPSAIAWIARTTVFVTSTVATSTETTSMVTMAGVSTFTALVSGFTFLWLRGKQTRRL